MKQIILPVTVNLTIRLPLDLIQPEPAGCPEPQTAPEPEAHSCHSCHSCGGCGKCQQKGVDDMAGNTTNISIRMDADLKAQADALFAELGMNLSTAFNIFVRQSLREGGIPFEVKLEQPNKETLAAMLEAERIAKDPSVRGYNDLDELFADLKR